MQYRRAVKHNTTACEILTKSSWCDSITAMKEKLRISPGALIGGATAPGDGDGTKDGGEGSKRKSGDFDGDTEDAETARLLKDSEELKGAVDNLMKHQVSFLVEQVSLGAQKMQFESTPLCMVKATRDSGNVNIIFDANCFGESDHRPEHRPCPIGKDKIDIPLRAILAARHGTADPKQIQLADLFTVFSGGKDRKRVVLKSLKTQGGSKRGWDKGKTYCRTIMLHASETSWRARNARSRGHCIPTQAIYMVGSHQTFSSLQYAAFKSIGGSNKSDVMGPVDLDNAEDLPTMSLAKKNTYLGKHFVLVGGRVEASGSESGGTSDNLDRHTEPEKAVAKDPPISYHALPVTVGVNTNEAFNVKHVVDLSPSPNNPGFEKLLGVVDLMLPSAPHQLWLHT